MPIRKQMTIEQALGDIRDGATIMVGGFLGCGSPNRLTDYLLDAGVRELTAIVNDSTWPEFGVGRLIAERRVRKLITSHIGTNPETGRQMMAGELIVELVPQGTFAERIRAGGAGLGGVLTPTGVGTLAAEGKRTIEVDGREYLLELPLRAEFALCWASCADEMGNLTMNGSTRNSNALIATAADTVIAQAQRVVPVGEIAPEAVVVPHVYVDRIVGCDL